MEEIQWRHLEVRGHWGAIIAEQTRNDGVRWKRQRGLGERLGPGRWYSWVLALGLPHVFSGMLG